MTSKEKAQQLADYFMPFCSNNYNDAKQCALIAVDEVLEATKRYDYTLGPNPSYNDYWLKIKYQIEKL